MRILIADTDYPGLLEEMYRREPDLAARSYDAQWAARARQWVAGPHLMAQAVRDLGHEALAVCVNCGPMQKAWAREHHVRLWPLPWPRPFVPRFEGIVTVGAPWFAPVIRAQVAQFKPDVILNQCTHTLFQEFWRGLPHKPRLLVGQVASPLKSGERLDRYDLMLSSMPHFVANFRGQGVCAEYLPWGFDPAVVAALGNAQRDIPVSFVGSLSAAHRARLRWLEDICRAEPRVKVWAPDARAVAADSATRRAYQGPAFGAEMFRVLARSQITLNSHTDVAGDYANNVRLFEATGMGALLLTDWKRNLAELFDPEREVVAYRSTEECSAAIKRYLDDGAAREAIAAAGQRRTLTQYSHAARTRRLLGILEGGRV
jgi:hypothetical protein